MYKTRFVSKDVADRAMQAGIKAVAEMKRKQRRIADAAEARRTGIVTESVLIFHHTCAIAENERYNRTVFDAKVRAASTIVDRKNADEREAYKINRRFLTAERVKAHDASVKAAEKSIARKNLKLAADRATAMERRAARMERRAIRIRHYGRTDNRIDTEAVIGTINEIFDYAEGYVRDCHANHKTSHPHGPAKKREGYGQPIPGSRLVRSFCPGCGDAMRVCVSNFGTPAVALCQECDPRHQGCSSPPCPNDDEDSFSSSWRISTEGN